MSHYQISPQELDFAAVYGYKDYMSAYSTRRQWRILSLAQGLDSSSPPLPADVDWVGNGLPFSIEVRGSGREKEWLNYQHRMQSSCTSVAKYTPYASTHRDWPLLPFYYFFFNLESSTASLIIPFSDRTQSKVGTLVSVADVMAWKRDFYEGTRFDLSQGPAAGPYGDPRRFDASVR
jgi:hypothetical protein